MSKHPLLNMASYGAETGTPLVLVHGLFGSGRNWRAIGRHLSRDRWVVTVDLRNHGHSFWDADNSYQALADDLARVIDHLGGRADVMGHSMGGKAAMVLAVQNPDKVARLIVADIAPVGYAHSQNDSIAAMQSLDLSKHDRRSTAQDALETATNDPALAGFFAQSLELEDGELRWLLNLDALKSNMNAVIGFPTLDGSFSKDTLFIRGGASDYVGTESREEVLRLFPHATLKTITGAGHWLHADKPREFMKILGEYLAR
ncbi:alpha/beta fold hydrolase [Amylibacter sp. IMCC11727]|uniref:alpha/beta fold hydrolase n=1 Tax=Amylibacter sp. IMCC11727 TaxID=3039851 RepID=UPI00244DE3F8|nr:alpha/beta fold hydrolase [Amylibacter sp. IMCC11727]WGI21943.1 alpha/beta fold hydrolase [Amylibacter sp. IMCC11727]